MVAVMRLPVGPDPGILPGQALELYVALVVFQCVM